MRPFILIIILVSLSALAQEIVFLEGFENHSPVILSSPPTTASLGAPYGYDVNAEDIDGDTLLYLLTTSPEGMTIDSVSGLIEWTPDTLGTYPVALDVSDGQGGSAAQTWEVVALEIVDSDGDGLSDDDEAIAGTNPNDPDSDDDGVLDGAEVFAHGTDPLDPDTDGDSFFDGSELAVGTDPLDPEDFPDVPPDPATVAPASDQSVAGHVQDTTAFLYTGPDPIQTGVSDNSIDLVRAALLRGTVFTRLGAPLPGVVISVLGRPEFGSTLSRADGRFDLAVNGGSPLTIDYQLTGFLPAQRTVEAGWQEWVTAPDVALMPLDPVVTPVDLTAPGDMKVARGSVQTDDDGGRQATMLFPAGVAAELRMPDDSTIPISKLSVRATEYTVGDAGEMAMPAGLPPTSGYTYAVELSVDEAMAMGASSVEFDQPIPFYVENFLGFPAGTPVPTGYYDRNLGAWVPAPDGLVIKIVGESGGLADIDIDGDDAADSGVPLTALGVTEAERTQIANLYVVGQSLWRVPVTHFTSWDHNWPIGPPADAVYPSRSRPREDQLEDGMCLVPVASSVECQNQVLRERIELAGTPFTLNYSSGRTPGRASARHLEIPVTGDALPASLKRVEVHISVAGKVYDFSYDAIPGLIQPLTWDGLDAYGRPVQGSKTASIKIDYVYEGVYRTGGSGTSSFGQPGQLPIEVEGNRTRADFTLPQAYQAVIGAWDARGQGLGGWTLNVHHAYDAQNQVLYRGDGTKRSAEQVPAVLDLVVGLLDEEGYAVRCIPSENPTCGVGMPAREASLAPVAHIAFGPDGTMYLTQSGLNQVRRVGPSGILEHFAGTGESYVCSEDGTSCPNGDGGPAVDAKFGNPYSLAADAFGNVYIGEIAQGTKRIRKVDPNGIITTYAGGGTIWPPVGPVSEVEIWPLDMEVDATGNLFVTDFCHVIRIDTAGYASIIAGTEDEDICDDNTGDGGPAALASIGAEGIALGPDGSIYLAESFYGSVRKIGKDGIIQTVAGTGVRGFSGDGGPALNAQFEYLYDLAVTPDGGIYVPDWDSGHVRYIDTDGVVRSVAGVGFNFDESGMFGPALSAWLYPFYIKLGPDGNVYLPMVGNDASVRVIKSPMSGLGAGDLLVPSEDGSEIYRFNGNGRHLQTLHALTGGVLYEFGYDADGRLETVSDGDSNVTTVQRDVDGNPTTLAGPFGQVTTLELDANGFLESITNPASESLQIVSTSGGLITHMTDARGHSSAYSYDDLGRLTQTTDRASKVQTFARTTETSQFAVTRTSAEGNVSTYTVAGPMGLVNEHEIVAPDGTVSTAVQNQGVGSTSYALADGTERSVTRGPDPRFGMQVPVVRNMTVNRPGGGTASLELVRSTELADDNDPLSLISWMEMETLDGNTVTRTYTAGNREFVVASAMGRTDSTTVDTLGRTTNKTQAGLFPTTLSYESRGFLESVSIGESPDMREWTFVHNAQGYMESTTDPLGRVRSYVYDAVGRTTSSTLPDGRVLAYSYDANGNLVSVTPPGRPAHTLTYTTRDQVASIVPPATPNSGPTTFVYDQDGKLTDMQRPDGKSVSFEYDGAGRPVEQIHTTNAIPTLTTTMTYDDAGRFESLTTGSLVNEYAYDGDSLLSETWSGDVSGVVAWTYDSNFRPATQTVNGGNSVQFGYDDDGLLIQAGSFTLSRNPSSGFRSNSTLGVVTAQLTINGFGEPTDYDVSVSGSPIYGVEYTYSTNGQITKIVETIDSNTDVYDYGYDLAGRLVNVAKNTVEVESYGFDTHGNRTNATTFGNAISATYDDLDRLLSYDSTTYSHNANGEVTGITTGGQSMMLEYDALGHLEGVVLPDATQIEYLNDGLRRRIGKRVGGMLQQAFLYQDGLRIIAELDGSGQLVSRFVYAQTAVPAYMIRGGTTYRIIADHRGSVRLVLNASTGQIAQRIDYDSFGNVLFDSSPGFQPFGFAGGIYDPDTGLVRFGAREYDARTGRWLTRDPAWFAGVDTNLYRYSLGDPLNYADRTGMPPNPLNEWWDELTELEFDPKNPETAMSLEDPEVIEQRKREFAKTDKVRKKFKRDVRNAYLEPGNHKPLPPKEVLNDAYECRLKESKAPRGGGTVLRGVGNVLSALEFIKLAYKALINGKTISTRDLCNAINPLPNCWIMVFPDEPEYDYFYQRVPMT